MSRTARRPEPAHHGQLRAGPPEGHQPLLGPLAEHPEQSVVTRGGRPGKARPPRRSGPPSRRGVPGGPGHAGRRARISAHRIEQPEHVGPRPGPWAVDRGRRGERTSVVGSCGDHPPSPSQESVEAPEGGGGAGHRRRVAALRPQQAEVALEGFGIGGHRLDPYPHRPTLPAGDIASVGDQGVARPTFLDRQPGQELLGSTRQRLWGHPVGFTSP